MTSASPVRHLRDEPSKPVTRTPTEVPHPSLPTAAMAASSGSRSIGQGQHPSSDLLASPCKLQYYVKSFTFVECKASVRALVVTLVKQMEQGRMVFVLL